MKAFLVLFLTIGILQSHQVNTSPTEIEQPGSVVRVVARRSDCTQCGGSAKCQSCYPAGSKKGYGGESCYYCSGSGVCTQCAGSGHCHLCDGFGFDTGCNNCSKVLKNG